MSGMPNGTGAREWQSWDLKSDLSDLVIFLTLLHGLLGSAEQAHSVLIPSAPTQCYLNTSVEAVPNSKLLI